MLRFSYIIVTWDKIIVAMHISFVFVVFLKSSPHLMEFSKQLSSSQIQLFFKNLDLFAKHWPKKICMPLTFEFLLPNKYWKRKWNLKITFVCVYRNFRKHKFGFPELYLHHRAWLEQILYSVTQKIVFGDNSNEINFPFQQYISS